MHECFQNINKQNISPMQFPKSLHECKSSKAKVFNNSVLRKNTYRQPRLGDALAFWPHPNFPSLSHALPLYKIYAKDKPFSCVYCEAVFSAKFAKYMHQNEYIGIRYVEEYQSKDSKCQDCGKFRLTDFASPSFSDAPRYLTQISRESSKRVYMYASFLSRGLTAISVTPSFSGSKLK